MKLSGPAQVSHLAKLHCQAVIWVQAATDMTDPCDDQYFCLMTVEAILMYLDDMQQQSFLTTCTSPL